MTKNEVIRVIGVLTVAYPNFDKFRDEKHIASMVIVWANMFVEDPANIVELAVNKHIMTSKWPPSINEIREIMVSITNPDLIDVDEAWTAVSKVLFTYSEFDSEGALYALPQRIAEVVKAIGINTLRNHYRKHNGLDRVAFKDMYEAVLKRQREEALLPENLRRQISLASSEYSLGEREKLYSIEQKASEREDFYRMLPQMEMQRHLESHEPNRIGDNTRQRLLGINEID